MIADDRPDNHVSAVAGHVLSGLAGFAVAATLAVILFTVADRRDTPYPRFAAPTPRVVVKATSLAGIARDYARTLPDTFADLARQTRSGAVRDKASSVAATKAHAAPLADALDKLYLPPRTDAAGRIVDPAAVADEFDAAARALRSR